MCRRAVRSAAALLSAGLLAGCAPQTVAFDPTRPVERSGLMGAVFKQDGKVVDRGSLRDGLEANEEADRYMDRSRAATIPAYILAAVGGGMMGWAIGASTAPDEDVDSTLLGGGAGVAAGGLLLAVFADSQAGKAVDAHNASLAAATAACSGKGRIEPAEGFTPSRSPDFPEYVSIDGRSTIGLSALHRGDQALGALAKHVHDALDEDEYERVSEAREFTSGRTPGVLRIFRREGPPRELIHLWVFVGDECAYELRAETDEEAYEDYLERLLAMARSFHESEDAGEGEGAGEGEREGAGEGEREGAGEDGADAAAPAVPETVQVPRLEATDGAADPATPSGAPTGEGPSGPEEVDRGADAGPAPATP